MNNVSRHFARQAKEKADLWMLKGTVPPECAYEEATFRGAAALLHRKLVQAGLNPERAIELIQNTVATKVIQEYYTDLKHIARKTKLPK